MRRKATLGFELPGGSEPPTEFRIFPFGEIKTSQGDFLFDEAAAEAVLAEAKEWGNQLSVDFNHQQPRAIEGATPTGEAPAAAWFDLELREDGLWAINIQWTPDAAEALGKRQYRYFSPWLDYDPDNGRIMRLNNLALTNVPATQDMEPIVATLARGQLAISWRDLQRELLRLLRAKYPDRYLYLEDVLVGADGNSGAAVYEEGDNEERFQIGWRLDEAEAVLLEGDPIRVRTAYTPTPNGGEQMETVMAKLGLSKSASEAEALSAVSALADRAEVSTQLATLTGKDSDAEALGVLEAWKQSHGRVAEVEAELATIEAKREEAELARLIEEGIEAGKLEPTDDKKAWAQEQGVAGLKAYLGATQPKVKTTVTKAPTGASDSVTLGQAMDDIEAEWRKGGKHFSMAAVALEARSRHQHLRGEE